MDIRKSHLHIKAHKSFGPDPQIRFVCFRCKRNLSEGEFPPVGERGVGRRKVVFLHPLCTTCRRQIKSECSKHPLVTPEIQRFMDKMISSIKYGAKERGIVVAIDTEDLLEMYISQQGLCALTGVTLRCRPGSKVDKARDAASLDRIDSSANYTRDNVHFVARVVNQMKTDMSVEEFGEWCKRVVLHALASAPE